MTDTAARRGAAAATRRVDALRRDAATCRDCDLYARATQTVFGEGPGDAKLMLMGEQPGDREDRAGRPFVGPAGRLLDEALEEAGIDRGDVYVTNAVKHFKWRPAGKVRLHQKPNARQVAACRQWWEQEVEAVAPDVLCCLGATAAQAVLGSSFRVSRQRGTFVRLASGVLVTATVHPSSILRADDDTRASERARFVEDLRAVAAHLR
jgi:uracil-DNA glycosylase family protein